MFDIRRHASLEGYVEDLHLVLHDVAVEGCIYVGHSVSAMIGLIAAQRMPGRFERMFMIAPSPRLLNDGTYRGGFEPEDLQSIYDSIAAHYRDWAAAFAPFVACQDPDSAVARDFTESLLAIRPDVALWAARVIFESDVRDRLAACTSSPVILQVRNDPAVPMTVAAYLMWHLRGAVLEVLDSAGHLSHLSAPDKVMAAIERHLPD